MAVYSWCDLISPWRVVRAADQIVGKKQFSNFGVRVICILSVCIPAVREQILVVAHLVRLIGNVPPPWGAGAADSHPERDLSAPLWHLCSSSKTQLICVRLYGLDVHGSTNSCFEKEVLGIC